MILTENGVLKLMQRIKSFIASQLNTKAPSVHTHTISEIDDLSSLSMGGGYTKSELYSLIYPVGSIYLSVNSVDPSTIFGGTWEQIKDTFLLSSGDTYSIGSTGGNSSTTLEIANLPSHNHTGTTGNQSANHTHGFSGTTSGDGSHIHNLYGRTWTWGDTDASESVQAPVQAGYWGYNALTDHAQNSYTQASGSHTHTFSGTTGGISANHNHSFTTSSVGSAESFSNMPPYLTINVWKRIA